MENWEVQAAQLFKNRDNKTPPSVTIGTVITGLPNLTVTISDEIILDEELVIANRIYSLSLQVGDELILVPSSDAQKYMVIDKVGE